LNRWILRNHEPWIKLGLLPAFLADNPNYSCVGTEPTDNISTVISAWTFLHKRTRSYVASATPENLLRSTSDIDFGQGTVGKVLQGLVRHDLHHIRKVESMIAKAREG
jgi:hypothetical protein